MLDPATLLMQNHNLGNAPEKLSETNLGVSILSYVSLYHHHRAVLTPGNHQVERCLIWEENLGFFGRLFGAPVTLERPTNRMLPQVLELSHLNKNLQVVSMGLVYLPTFTTKSTKCR